ncbi:MAG: DUF488 family protein [Candidatus Aminicenantes bacterium]|nr:DUF488 family protein [Candidatus Aminicenantes bacterium]
MSNFLKKENYSGAYPSPKTDVEFYTIGHSTRKIEEFISLLRAYRIEVLVDVRAFPVSTRNPQFNKENLKESLFQNDIEYVWLGREFGGYRKKSEGLGESSPNKGWKVEGFRIYVDYMLTDIFKSAADQLINLSENKTVTYMCAEKFYWRCHRRLISDYLLSRGHKVWHIIESDKLRKHELTKFAQVKEGILTYPP